MLWAPCFVLSIGKVHVSMSYNGAGILWTRKFWNLILNQTKKRISKRFYLSSKLLAAETLAEIQFVIVSCCLISQSNYLNSSNKDFDWFILAFFLAENRSMLTLLSFRHLENKALLIILTECVGKLMNFFIIKIQRSLGCALIWCKTLNRWSTQEVRNDTRICHLFPYKSWQQPATEPNRFLRALQQSRAPLRLSFYLLLINCFPHTLCFWHFKLCCP